MHSLQFGIDLLIKEIIRQEVVSTVVNRLDLNKLETFEKLLDFVDIQCMSYTQIKVEVDFLFSADRQMSHKERIFIQNPLEESPLATKKTFSHLLV